MPTKPESTHPSAAAFPPGMSGPSLRALKAAGITSLRELGSWTEADVAALHGMGPKVLGILLAGMQAAGIRFKPPLGRGTR